MQNKKYTKVNDGIILQKYEKAATSKASSSIGTNSFTTKLDSFASDDHNRI
jgi:hypothetical protein